MGRRSRLFRAELVVTEADRPVGHGDDLSVESSMEKALTYYYLSFSSDKAASFRHLRCFSPAERIKAFIESLERLDVCSIVNQIDARDSAS